MVAEIPQLQIEARGAVAKLYSGFSGELVISGPAGTGKTRGILDWIHLRCSREKLRVLFLRKTLESLKVSALVTFTEQVLYEFDGKESRADGVTYFGGNNIIPAAFNYSATGSVIILGGMDNPAKVLSTEYDIIYVNECTELTLGQWETLGGRTDRPKMEDRPQSLLLGDCNPGPPTHWIKRRAQDQAMELWYSWHRDNPAMWDLQAQDWTVAGQRYLSRLKNYSGVLRQRFLLGIWAAAEGQVYESWRDQLHLVNRSEIFDTLVRFFGTMDWGWTNPGVAQVWGVDGDGRLFLVAEQYMTKKSVQGWWVPVAESLSATYGFRRWLCDPAEPANIELLRDKGLDARKAENSLAPGISAVQSRLILQDDRRPRLFICREALIERDEALYEDRLPVSTEQEMALYVWAKNAGGETLKDKPVDAYNHGMDCLRYAVAEEDLRGVAVVQAPAPVKGKTLFISNASDAANDRVEWGDDPWA